MIGFIYLGEDIIGEVDFQIIDESMGAIGGNLIVDSLYKKYQNKIRKLYDQKGIANSYDFNFEVVLNGSILQPEGGIGITDSSEFDEIYVEVAGLNSNIIGSLK
jgi:hypothetical protein